MASERPPKLTFHQKQAKTRVRLFPDVPDDELWVRQRKAGFATVPRAMPLVMVLMDKLSPNKPLGQTYLALWTRAWDDPLVSIGSKLVEIAYEAGFSGQRAVNSLTSRLAVLKELDFVRFAAGLGGTYSHALILNPYRVLRRHRERFSEEDWNSLAGRLEEIGADDLDAFGLLQSADSLFIPTPPAQPVPPVLPPTQLPFVFLAKPPKIRIRLATPPKKKKKAANSPDAQTSGKVNAATNSP